MITSRKRAVLITGCDSGFGNATALKLNELGYRVYATVLDPDCEGAKILVNEPFFGDKTQVIRMDVTNEKEVKGVYKQIKIDLQRNGEELWAVVNNAAITMYGPIDWGTIDCFKNVFDVNTFGTVRVTRIFLPLIRQSKGRIVIIASVGGRQTFANLSVYSMSKSAVISFSDALRRENKKWGIKVSTIEPMAYRTSMTCLEQYYSIIDKMWGQTTESVQKEYGKQFYENFRKNSNILKNILNAEQNISGVIDRIVDAIGKPEPEISYLVGPKALDKIVFYMLNFLPTEINDLLFELIEIKNSPALLNKN